MIDVTPASTFRVPVGPYAGSEALGPYRVYEEIRGGHRRLCALLERHSYRGERVKIVRLRPVLDYFAELDRESMRAATFEAFWRLTPLAAGELIDRERAEPRMIRYVVFDAETAGN